MKRVLVSLMVLAATAGGMGGCATFSGPNNRVLQKYSFSNPEAAWIRNGRPIRFEGKLWYPQDTIEVMTDNEVYLMGSYRGVQFFIAKRDVRPFNQLYTKFGRNKFRLYTTTPQGHD